MNDRLRRITTKHIRNRKVEHKKISCLTAYDYTFAKIFDSAGIDIILVGDSASNVIQGNETTLPITLDEMIYHAKCVTKACEKSLVVVDLPFGTYQSDSQKALQSAIRIMKESNAHAVKLEGGKEILESMKKIINAGIPVMGHLGLMPQSINLIGTYKVQAQEKQEATSLMNEAKLLEKTGAFSVVLEKIPADLAKKITQHLKIPTIGIGAGNSCDGQVLVMHDMLGLNKSFNPRFVRRYLELFDTISQKVKQYIKDINSLDFPNEKEKY